MKVFTYGTLMRGFGANHMLPDNGRDAVTHEKFTLLDLGLFPGLWNEPQVKVRGEVYEVDEKTLSALDVYEGEGSLYRRREIAVDAGEGVEFAWAYFIAEKKGPPVESGDWRKRV